MALAIVAGVLLRLCRLMVDGRALQACRLARTCTAVWFVGLLVVTLGGRPRDANGHLWFNWIPFASQTSTHAGEILANLFLFTPAGLMLVWMVRKPAGYVLSRAAIASALLSLTIELIQMFTPLGTAGDLTDIVLNTSGGVLGAIAGVLLHKFLAAKGSAPVVGGD